MPKLHWETLLLFTGLVCFLGAAGACVTSPHQGEMAVQTTAPAGHPGCYVCHRSETPETAGPQGFGPGVAPSEACQDCHRYERDHHPVNFVPEASSYVNAARSGLPLFDGQLVCLTCHKAHEGETTRPSGTPKLLRGDSADRRALCFSCHYKEQYAKTNPHEMLDEEGRIRSLNERPVCLFCHDEVPDLLDHNSEMSFRADIAFLCWRCHAPMKGNFLSSHFHVSPTEKTRVQMETLLSTRNVNLPLPVDGMVTCSTCHNPHEKGVLLDGPVSTGVESPKRLRLAEEDLCSGCHGQL